MADDFNVRQAAVRSDAIAEAVRHVSDSGLTAMDYGCGPGHIGLRLMNHFSELTFVDNDETKLAAVRHELTRLGNAPDSPDSPDDRAGTSPAGARADALCWDAAASPFPSQQRPVDIIFSALAFHHVQDIANLTRNLAHALKPGGQLIVAELDSDDGAFHRGEPGFQGHNGFDRSALAQTISQTFDQVTLRDVWAGRRDCAGLIVDYSVFLVAGRSAEGNRSLASESEQGTV